MGETASVNAASLSAGSPSSGLAPSGSPLNLNYSGSPATLPPMPVISANGDISPAMKASMGLSAVSSITTAISQASALKATGKYQSSIANVNATMANMTAKQTLMSGDIAAGNKNLQTREVVGSIKAVQGASGVSVGSGSNAAVATGENLVGTVDEMTIRNNAQRRAFGFNMQAMNDTSEGKFANITASNEAMQSLLSGGLQALAGPTRQYAEYLMWTRRLGGGAGTGLPYPNAGGGS